MTKTATPRGAVVGEAKPTDAAPAAHPTDWESIERLFRAGSLSVSEIARRHSISEGAIRKRSKRDGWKRDLTAKFKEAVRDELVRTTVRDSNASATARTERQIVDEAAQTAVAVVKLHRRDARVRRELLDTLMSQLTGAAGNRDAIEAEIFKETAEADDFDPDNAKARQAAERKRKAMLAAVALPTHFAALRDGVTSMGKLVAIERQAFNIGNGTEIEPPAPPAEAPVMTDEALDAYAAKLAMITGAALAAPAKA